jgi:hypothetical protein
MALTFALWGHAQSKVGLRLGRPLLSHGANELVELNPEGLHHGILALGPPPFGLHDGAQVDDCVLKPVDALLCVHAGEFPLPTGRCQATYTRGRCDEGPNEPTVGEWRNSEARGENPDVAVTDCSDGVRSLVT